MQKLHGDLLSKKHECTALWSWIYVQPDNPAYNRKSLLLKIETKLMDFAVQTQLGIWMMVAGGYPDSWRWGLRYRVDFYSGSKYLIIARHASSYQFLLQQYTILESFSIQH